MTFSLNRLHIDGLKGLVCVEVDVEPEQHAYVVIGKNGVGKTKPLSAISERVKYEFSFFKAKCV